MRVANEQLWDGTSDVRLQKDCDFHFAHPLLLSLALRGARCCVVSCRMEKPTSKALRVPPASSQLMALGPLALEKPILPAPIGVGLEVGPLPVEQTTTSDCSPSWHRDSLEEKKRKRELSRVLYILYLEPRIHSVNDVSTSIV